MRLAPQDATVIPESPSHHSAVAFKLAKLIPPSISKLKVGFVAFASDSMNVSSHLAHSVLLPIITWIPPNSNCVARLYIQVAILRAGEGTGLYLNLLFGLCYLLVLRLTAESQVRNQATESMI